MMDVKRIRELLTDKEVYSKLLTIGQARNRIWYLHRQAENLESEITQIQTELQNKNKISFTELVGISIMADNVFEDYMKHKSRLIKRRKRK